MGRLSLKPKISLWTIFFSYLFPCPLQKSLKYWFKLSSYVLNGLFTPPDHWYDQKQDEWVILLQGQAIISYEDGREVLLTVGDYLLIVAHEKHRVEETSADPPCIWLAIHGSLVEN